jgi:ATP-dependent HslUV protease ATP-binding subunit HslU
MLFIASGTFHKQEEPPTSSSFSYAAPYPPLLPSLISGCSVPTRYGAVKTDFMLFIASGAFHHKSPSDLLPELQGRFPVRVALQPLNKEDLVQILSAKKFNLLEQTKQLLATEGVELEFTACGVEVRCVLKRAYECVGIGSARCRVSFFLPKF